MFPAKTHFRKFKTTAILPLLHQKKKKKTEVKHVHAQGMSKSVTRMELPDLHLKP